MRLTYSRRFILLTALLITAMAAGGCVSIPNIYEPPIKREPIDGEAGTGSVATFIRMSDPQAMGYITRDVSPTLNGGTWRWTLDHPELQFYLTSIRDLKFVMDYTIPDLTFADTGPVTLSILINSAAFTTIQCKRPGQQLHFEKAVPAAMLSAGALNRVTIEQDKLWTSKLDGARFGFILVALGFVK